MTAERGGIYNCVPKRIEVIPLCNSFLHYPIRDTKEEILLNAVASSKGKKMNWVLCVPVDPFVGMWMWVAADEDSGNRKVYHHNMQVSPSSDATPG